MSQLDVGKVQIYTGDGKGKTTAALGLMLRAFGFGLHPRMYQFMKHMFCSEHEAAQQFGLEIIQSQDKDPQKGVRDLYERALKDLEEEQVDVLILDETGEAMRRGLITREDIKRLIEAKPSHVELVFTGRDLEDKIGDLADLITEMALKRHYFDSGLLARKGIEY
ncbi:MAG: cob(I)yrinic acid a,c-diamide adenosyltransferase [Coriobacteriia bacterium]|nr:cob(I)yrinic acid a,c-diamide adenosyltransferase [Coriobacteriia bacterium]